MMFMCSWIKQEVITILIGLFWFMVFNATFQQYFSYIVVVSFIGGGNQSTCKKPLTHHKSLTNFIT